jgi:hypothetical protein
VEIASGGDRCRITPWSGALSAGTPPGPQTVAFSTFGSDTVTSDPRTIYPAIASLATTVTVGNLIVDGIASPGTLTATFTQVLEGGKSYVLTLDLWEVIFAGSNIYWDKDNGRMDFKPAGHVGDESFYQGLYFKWGSMVGMGVPAYANTSAQWYWPIDDDTWDTGGYGSLYAVYGLIPRMNNNLSVSNYGPDNDYVTNGYAADNGGLPFNYTNKFGDICRRINPDYRLPRTGEFGFGATYTEFVWGPASVAKGWAKGTDAAGNDVVFPGNLDLYNKPTNTEGTFVLDYASFHAGFATYRGIKFPAPGWLSTAGDRVGLGFQGMYLSSSLLSSSAPGFAYVQSTSVLQGSSTIDYAYSIRCVKN